MRLLSIVLLISLVISVQSTLLAQANTTSPQNYKVQVDEAIKQAKSNNYNNALLLARHSQEVLPYLMAYTQDADPNTCDVLFVLARPTHCKVTLQILAANIGHGHNDSVGEIFNNYSLSEIKNWGGNELKESLLKFRKPIGGIGSDISSAEALLLLTCFSPDTEIHLYLSQVQKNDLFYVHWVYHQGQTETQKLPAQTRLQLSTPVNLSLCLDVALAAEKDPSAILRIRQAIKQGDVDGTLTFLLEASRFISEKQICLDLIGLLHDKRPTRYLVGPAVPPDALEKSDSYLPSPHLRVCDLTLAAFAEKMHLDLQIPELTRLVQKINFTLPTQLFSNDQLKQGFVLFNKALTAFHSFKE